MAPNIILGLSNIGTALLIIAFSIPLILRKVKMNRLYGVRIRKSFESEENWFALNVYGGKQMVLWSVPILLAGVLCFFIPFTEESADVMSLLLVVAPISVSLAVAVTKIMIYAKRL